MAHSILTYSHCHPISYYFVNDDGTYPFPMEEAYNRIDVGDYQRVIHLDDISRNGDVALMLISFRYKNGNWGVMHVVMGRICDRTNNQNSLRIFPNKDIADTYMEKIEQVYFE